jgi:hypothetical protein
MTANRMTINFGAGSCGPQVCCRSPDQQSRALARDCAIRDRRGMRGEGAPHCAGATALRADAPAPYGLRPLSPRSRSALSEEARAAVGAGFKPAPGATRLEPSKREMRAPSRRPDALTTFPVERHMRYSRRENHLIYPCCTSSAAHPAGRPFQVVRSGSSFRAVRQDGHTSRSGGR